MQLEAEEKLDTDESGDEDEEVAHKATMDSILSEINIMVDIHKEGDDGYLWGGKQYNVLTTLINRADRKSTRLNSSHSGESRMPSSA